MFVNYFNFKNFIKIKNKVKINFIKDSQDMILDML